MPKFSIKDLLIATVLVAMGLALMMYGYKSWNPYNKNPPELPLFLLGGSLIVEGFLYPFVSKKALFAAFIGTCIIVAFLSLPTVVS